MTDYLNQRQQLMADIDWIVSRQYGLGNEELANEMIELLFDAICKNFEEYSNSPNAT